MRVVIEGQDRIEAEVPTTAVERPLLERAWVRAQVERLQAQRSSLAETDEAARAGLQKTIVELSTKYRVLSDFTALLVLESEWDYQRFNIDRNALADILTVGATGVELYNRKSPPALKPDPGTLVNREPREEFRGRRSLQRDAIPMMARLRPGDGVAAGGDRVALRLRRPPELLARLAFHQRARVEFSAGGDCGCTALPSGCRQHVTSVFNAQSTPARAAAHGGDTVPRSRRRCPRPAPRPAGCAAPPPSTAPPGA